MTLVHTGEATTHGGREGRARSSDGTLDVDLRSPNPYGGPEGPEGQGTNPEQLFAAGYAACFESVLRVAAGWARRPLRDARVTVRVALLRREDQRYALEMEVRGRLEGVSFEDAQILMQIAHGICPYSNATRGNIDVRLIVEPDSPGWLSA